MPRKFLNFIIIFESCIIGAENKFGKLVNRKTDRQTELGSQIKGYIDRKVDDGMKDKQRNGWTDGQTNVRRMEK
jgi:hypothetical protein